MLYRPQFFSPFILRPRFLWAVGIGCWVCMVVLGCRKEGKWGGDYPEEVGKILVANCATSGCHEGQSAVGAGGLNLENWASLFEGSRGGSPVIPYCPEQSYMLFSVNTDTNLGPVLLPTMPFNSSPLTANEYATLWNWIYEGAPNAKGEERFPPQSGRKKWYVGHQICDQVAVFDAESRQVMRLVDVGTDPGSIEYTFDIKVSPDGQSWYVVYFGTNSFISHFSTLTDEKVADIPLSYYGWSTMAITSDSRFGFVCSEYASRLQAVDLVSHSEVGTGKTFAYPVRGPVVHPSRREIYLADHQDKDLTIVAFDAQGNLGAARSVDLIQGQQPAIAGDIWPFEVVFLPDGSKYFVSCSHSREVRVYSGANDSLLAVVVLPSEPSKMAYSPGTGRVFVSCMNDAVTFSADPFKKGSVTAIDAHSHQVLGSVYSGFQPYSLYADDAHGVLVVTNRNADVNGPAPHHVSRCEGRNGYLTLVNLQTLQLMDDFKPELLADPSTVAGN